MHILVVPSWYSTPSTPTSGSFFREQSLALIDAGLKVTMANCSFLGMKDFGKIKSIESEYYDNKMKVYNRVTYSYLYHKFYFNPMPSIYYKKLKNLYLEIEKKEGKPDIIHAHSCLWAGPAAVRLGKKFNIPVVITEHNTSFSRNLLNKYETNIVKNSLEEADKVIAVSSGLKKDLCKITDTTKIEIIPNPVDIKQFNIENVMNKSENKFIFFTLCYLVEKKGIDILIKAFAKSFKGKDVLLYIGGDGDEKENLIKLSKEMDIENQVFFLGLLSRDEVKENMAKCDAFVLPSRHETFGVVFIEALACGKPIIATDTGGPNDIVNNMNGILVEKENVEELRLAMEHMLTNIDNYDKFEISNDCKNRFSNESVVKKIIKIYENL